MMSTKCNMTFKKGKIDSYTPMSQVVRPLSKSVTKALNEVKPCKNAGKHVRCKGKTTTISGFCTPCRNAFQFERSQEMKGRFREKGVGMMENKNMSIVEDRIRNHQCTICGTPMKKVEGSENHGTYETACEHGKGLMFSSG